MLNYPSINGIYMDMGSDGSRSLITAANNDLMQQYNNFSTDYNTQPNASAEADKIYNYSITNSTSNGPRPHWVFLNEIGANYSSPPTGTGSNWYNTGTAGATYRKWVIDVVTRLHDVYNFDIVVASPGRTALKVQQSGYNPFASDWQTLASKAIIYVETFVSGPDVMNSGSDYASRLNWVKSYYQSEMNAYSVYAGVDRSRLGAGENYTNNATYDYFGRAGLASASDWDYVIMLRERCAAYPQPRQRRCLRLGRQCHGDQRSRAGPARTLLPHAAGAARTAAAVAAGQCLHHWRCRDASPAELESDAELAGAWRGERTAQ